ncbi:DUF6892 domain-containing protein [Paenibacillus radicis (ex Gao et al. 2016)]|uniref:DUF6892 domain-containing protein n=1 Tax=Paenibacillus radicis (ex Gao et al. 2016) TaxID=1737354 RepID=A0A917GQA7_9BACL|nr:hypothetical protein [Paenibacillus radicis (ex Gao et al. 2016)]GGG53250.1 hypothetical protein GCM10010918_02400 [Paenibacillus radicis (ex Gao et al. 2016)]
MNTYTDHTGMFQDFNFKLTVIDALLDQNPAFEQELEQLKSDFTDKYEWYTEDSGPIPEILAFFSKLLLEKVDLDKVTELCFDGGNEIYQIIQPDWDGEDDVFDIRHVGGFENLANLKSVIYISMCEEEVLKPIMDKNIEIK